jgi:hypothetical protein
VLEHFTGVAGIFSGDENGFTQDPHRARTHVFEVSNWSGNKEKPAHCVIVSPRLMKRKSGAEAPDPLSTTFEFYLDYGAAGILRRNGDTALVLRVEG